MQSCISDVKAWATVNIIKLNDNKTELMLVTSKRTKHLHSPPTSITIGNAQIPFKKSVKNLSVTLDCHITMNAHVSNIARTCYFELRRLASIRRFLTSAATATLSAPPDRISELLHSMQSCISDVKAWATATVLKLNDSKTELMLVTSKRSKHLHNLPTSITIGNAQIPFKQSVKNLVLHWTVILL